jgi:hypothetical protein
MRALVPAERDLLRVFLAVGAASPFSFPREDGLPGAATLSSLTSRPGVEFTTPGPCLCTINEDSLIDGGTFEVPGGGCTGIWGSIFSRASGGGLPRASFLGGGSFGVTDRGCDGIKGIGGASGALGCSSSLDDRRP